MRDFEERRASVRHLLAQHQRLHALLARAHAAVRQMNGPDGDATLQHIAHIMELVRTELALHFAEEEKSGCLEEAASRCPNLSNDPQRIKSDHPQLLAELDCLIAESKGGAEDVAARIAVEREFDEFCATLHAHEAAENALLRKGFGTGINAIESEAARAANL